MGLDRSAPVTALPHVGPKRAALYGRLGIRTLGELVYHLPRDYLDLTRPTTADEAELGRSALISAEVVQKGGEQRIRKGLSIFRVRALSGGVMVTLTFFNTKYTVDALEVGRDYFFYGRLDGTLLKREMSSPTVISPDRAGTLLPLYPATAGLSSQVIGRDIQRALEQLTLCDPLPAALLGELSLPPLGQALLWVHRPQDGEQARQGRRRLSAEELLTVSLAMAMLRDRRRHSAPAMRPVSLDGLWASLPFTPTDAQLRAVASIAADLGAGRTMNRLIQGDVGSGKTLIAAAAAVICHENGCQSAIMAPTELLAEQHARTLREMLSPLGIAVCLVTGRAGVRERRANAAAIADGTANVVVGTQALLFGDGRFHRLGLVVADEQHRFGVSQRAALTAKGEGVHTLIMSATPIPRTLSLVVYGDLDVSLVDTLPSGRKPVLTYRIDSQKRQRALGFIKKHLDAGSQAYVVCPLVAEGEGDDGYSAERCHRDLVASPLLAGHAVALLHGKLPAKQKEAVMASFAAGETRLLVATTVVEVGVDVPNATVILIENAERFGLSQLHQLRGRVGRGTQQSYCILVSDAKGETATARLKALCQTQNGFAIAEEDLRLRGPGELLGVRQHGDGALFAGDLLADETLIAQAQQLAARLLTRDPLLALPEHAALGQSVAALLERVGEQLN